MDLKSLKIELLPGVGLKIAFVVFKPVVTIPKKSIVSFIKLTSEQKDLLYSTPICYLKHWMTQMNYKVGTINDY
jgi:hypothetical protein